MRMASRGCAGHGGAAHGHDGGVDLADERGQCRHQRPLAPPTTERFRAGRLEESVWAVVGYDLGYIG